MNTETAALPTLHIDGDACPVREEIYRVASRLGLPVVLVSNGSRGARPPPLPQGRIVVVSEGADAADDWIAEHITAIDICITADIPLAARCLERGARALSPKGHVWDQSNIGQALAGRALSQHLRESGLIAGNGAPMHKNDRARFLNALDAAAQAALKQARAG